MVGDRTVLLVILGAVAFVLLLPARMSPTCYWSRAVSRQHEMAVRAALGAHRLAHCAAMFTESLCWLRLAAWLDSLGALGAFIFAGRLRPRETFRACRKSISMGAVLGFTMLAAAPKRPHLRVGARAAEPRKRI